jgi:hypothetical protein
VSLVGFAVGGTFVNISYWELQYYELMVLVSAFRLLSAKAKASGAIVANPPNAQGITAS